MDQDDESNSVHCPLITQMGEYQYTVTLRKPPSGGSVVPIPGAAFEPARASSKLNICNTSKNTTVAVSEAGTHLVRLADEQ